MQCNALYWLLLRRIGWTALHCSVLPCIAIHSVAFHRLISFLVSFQTKSNKMIYINLIISLKRPTIKSTGFGIAANVSSRSSFGWSISCAHDEIMLFEEVVSLMSRRNCLGVRITGCGPQCATMHRDDSDETTAQVYHGHSWWIPERRSGADKSRYAKAGRLLCRFTSHHITSRHIMLHHVT